MHAQPACSISDLFPDLHAHLTPFLSSSPLSLFKGKDFLFGVKKIKIKVIFSYIYFFPFIFISHSSFLLILIFPSLTPLKRT